MYAIEEGAEFRGQVFDLHPKRFKQVYLRLSALQLNPRPPDAQMLDENIYRVRVGPYRISYEIDDERRRVRVFLLEVMAEGE
ncbi:MAG: type II toxin-antitoxin system RelE/ParE family toxin [Chloroflexota bacterium]|nr:MAG: type II toxin-antitoxin system RelE/ParE family toxin [Chloroflexota bacterium]